MGGLGWRRCACLWRIFPGALFHRAGLVRARHAHFSGCPAGRRPARRRRMDPPRGAIYQPRRHPLGAHSWHPDRGRHRRRLCGHLRRLRALCLHRARHGFHPARSRGACHTGGGVVARSCTGGARIGRRLCYAADCLHRCSQLLGALSLSRRRHRGGFCARPHAALALARDHRRGVRILLDLARPRKAHASWPSVLTCST